MGSFEVRRSQSESMLFMPKATSSLRSPSRSKRTGQRSCRWPLVRTVRGFPVESCVSMIQNAMEKSGPLLFTKSCSAGIA